MDIDNGDLRKRISGLEDVVARLEKDKLDAELNNQKCSILEEKLKQRIIDNHNLEVNNRKLQTSLTKLEENHNELKSKYDESLEMITKSKAENIDIQKKYDFISDKNSVLISQNSTQTLKYEKQIESIEKYHSKRYDSLLKSFNIIKQDSKKMAQMLENGTSSKAERNRIRKLKNKISEAHISYLDSHSEREQSGAEIKGQKHKNKDGEMKSEEQYKHEIKEYKRTVRKLQKQVKFLQSNQSALNFQETTLSGSFGHDNNHNTNNGNLSLNMNDNHNHSESKSSKNGANTTITGKKGKKKKLINADYLRNVLVQFLVLSDYLSDEQVVLIPVLASILKFSTQQKKMIDDAYNGNRFFLTPVEY